jgi:predicted O-methyltransferase YrrM
MRLDWGPTEVKSTDHRVRISTSVTPAETAELQRLATGRQVLEIGSCFGYSALQMALAGAMHVLAVDPHMEKDGGIPGSIGTMRAALRQLGVEDRVTICLNWSHVVMPALYAMGARFGLIFIDGDHSPEGVTSDLRWARQLVAAGGAICCHDFEEEQCPGVAEILKDEGPPTRVVETLWVLECR